MNRLDARFAEQSVLHAMQKGTKVACAHAKLLSDEDLLQVLMLRKSARQTLEEHVTTQDQGGASGFTAEQ